MMNKEFLEIVNGFDNPDDYAMAMASNELVYSRVNKIYRDESNKKNAILVKRKIAVEKERGFLSELVKSELINREIEDIKKDTHWIEQDITYQRLGKQIDRIDKKIEKNDKKIHNKYYGGERLSENYQENFIANARNIYNLYKTNNDN